MTMMIMMMMVMVMMMMVVMMMNFDSRATTFPFPLFYLSLFSDPESLPFSCLDGD